MAQTGTRELITRASSLLAVGFMSLVLGCATRPTGLTNEDQAQLGEIAVVKGYEKPEVKFDGVPNAATGALKGILVGILNPMAWTVGGPLFMGPYGAIGHNECGAKFDGIEDPGDRFQSAVFAIQPDDLVLTNLSALLAKARGKEPLKLGVPARKISEDRFNTSSLDRGSIDTVVQVETLEINLVIGWKDGCYPIISAGAEFRVIRVKDGQLLASTRGYGSTEFQGYSFRDLLGETKLLENSIKETLAKIPAQALCSARIDTTICPIEHYIGTGRRGE
jgi:hypothetical protein